MDKSKGHVAFIGNYEFWQLHGRVRKSHMPTTYIGQDGYRTGGREQGSMAQKDYILSIARLWNKA